MSILLDNRNRENEVRESIVQQPAPFFTSNPAASIWGSSTSSTSTGFWQNPPGFDFSGAVPPPPIEVLRFQEPRRPEVFVFGANLNAAADPSPKNNPRPVEEMLHEMRIGPEEKIPKMPGREEEFSKNFTVGSGAAAQGLNPRPRFSKLRKSTHQGKGKGPAGGAPIPPEENLPFTFEASSEGENFHTGEPSSNEIPAQDERKEGKAPWSFTPAGPETKSRGEPGPPGVFVFSAMRDSVSGIPDTPELSEEAKRVAENLTGLNLTKESSEGPGFVFGVRDRGPESTPVPEPAENAFVFRASGGFPAAATVARKKNETRSRKASSKPKPVRSRSSSSVASEESRGSPMDFSPCPDAGARFSPSPAAGNSDSEAKASESDVENLRAAAEELSLGKENVSDAARNLKREDERDEEAPADDREGFLFGTSESFSFTSSSADDVVPPRRRPHRRGVIKGGVSKAKTRSRGGISGASREGFEVEFDQGNKTPAGVWGQQSPQMMDFSGAAPSSVRGVVEQLCEKWRLRGNQAYANGDFPKAEEYYSRGVSSVSSNETSQSCIHASMLCYSNRAATRMVVGRMREALADCKRAMFVDPNFLRVRLRAGSCCLALGECESAATYFKDCLYRVRDHDRNDLKIASEASEGLRKTQQAQDYYKRLWEIVSDKDFTAALQLVNEALTISPFSEALQELKARCLVSIRKFDEVIETCEQTTVLAESNWPADPPSQLIPGFQPRNSPKVWRSWVTSKAFFYLGRLEDSAESLEKLGDLLSLCGTNKISQVFDADIESFSQFNALLHGLLRHKAAGNEAFQAGRHTEAVENYTAALACNSDARPFNAVLFCNRAAAYQALGHVADAIADSSRAVVLDSKYAKAISRRATLHALIRDYGQACIDLRRLTSLLESQARDTPRKAGQDLKQARERLASAEEELKKSHPIDHYVILGLDSSCSAVDIKKAYRKLALRHHPDKAGQLINEDGNWWKEATEEIRNDAERLFKLIGEAYAILSDPSKRSRYDAEEELRKLRTRSGMMNSASSSSSSENHRYHSHERSGRRQRDPWTGYNHQHQRWQSGADAAQPDNFARYFRTSSGVRSNDYNWDDL